MAICTRLNSLTLQHSAANCSAENIQLKTAATTRAHRADFQAQAAYGPS